jgi:glycosyltransferase involved in cell wall biosynthesis
MSGGRLHVLMTTDAVGGVFDHTVTLARALAEREIDVSIVILGPGPTADQRAALDSLAPLSVHELGLKLEWMEDPWEDLDRAMAKLREIERELRPDVIHAGSYFCGRAGFVAPVVVVAHSCVYSWWHAVWGCEPPAEWQRYREMVRGGLSGADAVVAPSQTMLAQLREHYGALPKRSLTILNGVQLDQRVAHKESFVLAAGRMWDPAKNLEALTAVAESLPRPVLIAGELPAPPAEDSFESSPVSNARLLGRLPSGELARLRRRAPVFASPARYEPFGLSILEAAGDRCALVLGDIPSLRELWDGCAEFVEPDDHEALLATLRMLLAHPKHTERLGHKARARAERLTPEPMTSAYAGLYRELVQATAVLA